MKFKELDEILQLKIKKSLIMHNFSLDILENAYVSLDSKSNVESIYLPNCEILLENNRIKKVNLL
jgi:hypothetical protein